MNEKTQENIKTEDSKLLYEKTCRRYQKHEIR